MITLTSRAKVAHAALEHCRLNGVCNTCPLSEECNGEINVLLGMAADVLAELLHNRLIEDSKKAGCCANAPRWIRVEDGLPDNGDVVLVVANGNPRENVKLHNATLIASYWQDEGWIADGYEYWDAICVSHWMPLPELPEGVTCGDVGIDEKPGGLKVMCHLDTDGCKDLDPTGYCARFACMCEDVHIDGEQEDE